MSTNTNIEYDIIEMQLENENFQKNAVETMSTLDKLKEKLHFSNASKGFDDVSNAIKRVDFNPLTTAVETVNAKFSAMEVIAVTTMSRITNAAIDTVKSMSPLKNIQAGWGKYDETNRAVGTLVAQGYALETVTDQLEKLNWYTDETSYSFVDMVQNISKFTASGQSLEDSVSAMEGIANWAALSGQNATTASRAMYQLSQAMSKGVMKLDDYKSIQNASMDTMEFRQKALDAAVALGTLKKNADGTYQSLMATGAGAAAFNINQFSTHLSDGLWFTKDVMMSVYAAYNAGTKQIEEYIAEHEDLNLTASEAIKMMEKEGIAVDGFGVKAFKAAQEARTFGDVIDSVKDAVGSGWRQTFDLIFGNYEEAKNLWSDLANELYDVFMNGLLARNEMLQIWKDNGGRQNLIEAFWTLWETLKEIANVVKLAFGPIDDISRNKAIEDKANRLLKVTNSLKSAMENLYIFVRRNGENITNTFKIIAAPIKLVKVLLGDIGKLVSAIFSRFSKEGKENALLKLTGSIGNTVEKLVDSFIELHDANIDGIINGIADAVYFFISNFSSGVKIILTPLTALKNGFVSFFSALNNGKSAGDAFSSFGKSFVDSFKSSVDSMNDIFNNFKNTFGGFASFVSSIPSKLKNTFGVIKNFFSDIFSSKETSGMTNQGNNIGKVKNSLVTRIQELASALVEAGKAVGTAIFAIVDAISNLIIVIARLITNIANLISSLFKGLSSLFEKMKNGLLDVPNVFNKFLDAMASVGSRLASLGKSIIKAFGNLFSELLTAPGKDPSKFELTFDGILSGLKRIILGIADVGKTLVKGGMEVIPDALKLIKSIFTDSGLKDIIVGFKDIQLIGLFNNLRKIFGFMAEKKEADNQAKKDSGNSKGFIGFINNFSTSITVLTNVFRKQLPELIKSYTKLNASKAIWNIAKSVALLAGVIILMSYIKPEKAMLGIIMVGTLFKIVSKVLTDVVNMAGKKNISWQKIASLALVMSAFSLFVSSMVIAVAVLGLLPSGRALVGVAALGLLMSIITATMTKLMKASSLKNFNGVKFAAAAAGMLILALAIQALVIPVIALGLIPYDAMLRGVGAITLLMISMYAIIKDLGGKKNSATSFIGAAASILVLAIAIQALTIPILALGLIPYDAMLRGAGAVMLMLLGMYAIVKDLGNKKNSATSFLAAAASILILSIAIQALTIPILALGLIPYDAMLRGVGSVMLMLFGMYAIVKDLGNKKNSATSFLAAASSITVLAAAINSLVIPVVILGSIPFLNMLQGLLAVTALMGVMYIAIKGLGKVKNGIASFVGAAISMMLIANAINMLLPAIMILGSMDLENLKNGLGSVMMLILSMTLSMALLSAIGGKGGINFIGMGVGLLALAAAISILSASILAIAAFTRLPGGADNLTVALLAIVGLLAAIGVVAALVSTPVLALGVGMLALGAGTLATAAGVFLLASALALLNPIMILSSGVISQFVVEVITGFANGFVTLLKIISENTHYIGDAVYAIVNTILDIVERSIPKVIEIIFALLNAVVQLANDSIPWLLESLLNLILTLTKGVQEYLRQITVALIDLIIEIIKSLADALVDRTEEIKEAIFYLCMKIVEAFCIFFGIHSPSTKFAELGKNLLLGLINGIVDTVAAVIHAIVSFCEKIIDTIAGIFGIHSPSTKFADIGKNLMLGLLEGIKGMAGSVVDFIGGIAGKVGDAVSNVAGKAWDGMKNVANGAVDLGKNVVGGIGKGISSAASAATDAIGGVCSNIVDGFTGFFQIFSPSRLMADESKYIPQGVAQGIDNYSDVPADSMRRMSKKMDSSFQVATVIDKIQLLEDKFDEANKKFSGATDIMPAGGKTGRESGAVSIVKPKNESKGKFAISEITSVNALNQNGIDSINTIAKTVTKISNSTSEISKDGKTTAKNTTSKPSDQDYKDELYDIISKYSSVNSTSSLFGTQAPNIESYTGGLGTSSSAATSAQSSKKQVGEDYGAIVKKEFADDITKIVKELYDIRNDIHEFQASVTDRQVVLDSGTVVGALTDKIDKALGDKLSLVTRGV